MTDGNALAPQISGLVRKTTSVFAANRAKRSQRELQRAIRNELAALPFFSFAAFGFADPDERARCGAAIWAKSKGTKSDIFSDTGRLQPQMEAMLKAVVDGTEPSME